MIRQKRRLLQLKTEEVIQPEKEKLIEGGNIKNSENLEILKEIETISSIQKPKTLAKNKNKILIPFKAKAKTVNVNANNIRLIL